MGMASTFIILKWLSLFLTFTSSCILVLFLAPLDPQKHAQGLPGPRAAGLLRGHGYHIYDLYTPYMTPCLYCTVTVTISCPQNPNNMPKGFPRPGWGDYLVGMATTFVIGLLSNRSFVMQPLPFTAVVDPGTSIGAPRGHVPMDAGRTGSVLL